MWRPSWSPRSSHRALRLPLGPPRGEAPAPGNSVLVEFTLSPEGSERTRLQVSETGLDTIGWPEEQKESYAEDHRNGWAFFVGRLEGMLAAGSD